MTLILTQNKKEDLMKFIVNSTALLRELQKLNGVISSNNTLPILDNFLFDINSNNMTIIASDLETTMMSTISVEADVDGKITIPARILIDTLKTFSNQPLTFIVNTETFGIEMSSEMGNYKLAGQNADCSTSAKKFSGFLFKTILPTGINGNLSSGHVFVSSNGSKYCLSSS